MKVDTIECDLHPLHLVSIEITDLFNKFSYIVDFDNNEGLSFVYGINGCGKTTMLNIISGFSNGDILDILKIPFKKVKLTLCSSTDKKVFYQFTIHNKIQNTIFEIKTPNKKRIFYNFDARDESFFSNLKKYASSISKNTGNLIINFDHTKSVVKKRESNLELNNLAQIFKYRIQLGDLDQNINGIMKEIQKIKKIIDIEEEKIEDVIEKIEELKEEENGLNREIKKYELLIIQDQYDMTDDYLNEIEGFKNNYYNNIGTRDYIKEKIENNVISKERSLNFIKQKNEDIEDLKISLKKREDFKIDLLKFIVNLGDGLAQKEELQEEEIFGINFQKEDLFTNSSRRFMEQLIFIVFSFRCLYISSQRLDIGSADLINFQDIFSRKIRNSQKHLTISDLDQITVSMDEIKSEILGKEVIKKAKKLQDLINMHHFLENKSFNEKILMFESIVNEFLIYKMIQTQPECGFFIENEIHEEIPLNKLSSGEKNIIIIFFELIFENKCSLVLIDEPEISLHVSWQLDFVEPLMRIQKNDPEKNLYFLIATHSPHIIEHRRNLCYGPNIQEND